jgi:hypothetical protein
VTCPSTRRRCRQLWSHSFRSPRKWGIGDDIERELALDRASTHEIEELVHSTDHVTDEDLDGWLAGSESFNPNPSDEYVAITCLMMAIDSAKFILRQRRIGAS